MRDLVDAPPVQPPRYGLIAAAPVVTDAARWQLGFSFQPAACASSGGRLGLDDCTRMGTMTAGTNPAPIDGDPFVVWADDTCTSRDRARDRAQLARQQLAATESYQVAEELWSGSLGLPQRSLTDAASDTVTGSAATATQALACLEQGLARCLKGRRGMIHVTPQVLTVLVGAQVAARDGGLITTALGTIIVADAGYDGSGPGGVAAGATQWAYATSMVQVLLGPVEITPPDLDTPENVQIALNREDNTISVFAHRLATYKWDECCHLAAEVDLPVCALGGS